MRHITLTGYYAGETVCGAPKGIEGDTYAHAGEWLDNPKCRVDLCTECAKIWDDIETESENDD